MMHKSVRVGKITLLILGLVAPIGRTGRADQPAAPPPPREYKVHVRYRIRAAGNVRIAQFLSMTRFLQSIGFAKDPGPENEVEDPTQTLLTGTIASDRAARILAERHVQAIVLIPAGYTVPAETDKPVKVQLALKSGLALERQRLLADQTRELLGHVGFHEAIGYDNRDHTRLVGWVPAANLDQLLVDLRWQGSGWLVPGEPVPELPLPIRNTWPVLIAEVLPEPAGLALAKQIAAAPPAAIAADNTQIIAADLRALAKETAPRRVELIYVTPPPDFEYGWRRALKRVAPGLQIEGHAGQVVTVRVGPDHLMALANLPYIISIQQPRLAMFQYVSADTAIANIREALKASGVAQLHERGLRGRGVRVAVIDADFRGYQAFIGKQLSAETRYVDMTAQSEPSIEPKRADQGPAVGHGTQIALALALAAPDAELTLLRIDAEAPYQLLAAARYISGDPVHADSLEDRSEELAADALRLQTLRDELLQERKRVLENFGQDKASVEMREAYFKKEADLTSQEQVFERREVRFTRLVRDLQSLQGTRVVACGLTWDDGYPTDGGSVPSRYFDDRPFRAALWFQAISNTHGQSWAGPFRDGDGNGVMEFAAPQTPLPVGRWTRELNFLGWQPLRGVFTPDLPRIRLRVSIQWREPHDPTLAAESASAYRLPLANLRLVVLRQRDPSGTRLPADDLEVIATSVELPLRLDNSAVSATYEQTIEFQVDTPGRYAVRVEGQVPHRLRPLAEPTLPSQEVSWELKPRLFLNVLDETARTTGRVVFADFPTGRGGVGMPADAHEVISVGAKGLDGKPEPYSASGSPVDQELHLKPDVLGLAVLPPGVPESQLSTGAGQATGFLAGEAACFLQDNLPALRVRQQMLAR